MKISTSLVLFLFTLFGINANPITILPLGDSLTWGAISGADYDFGGGYRDALYEGLVGSLQWTVMTGPSDDHPSSALLIAGQQFHSGFPGYRIDQIAANLDADNPPWPGNYGGYWLTGIPGIRPPIYPDIILLMAGTNDIAQNAGAQLASERLNGLLYKLFTLRPTTHVIVAKIPPIFGTLANDVKLFNVKVDELASWYKALGFKITVADQYTPFLPYQKHFEDSVHPEDDLIYRVIGFQWLPKVLEAIYQLTSSSP